jgi:two-component system, NtrC family, sensor kinase
MFKKTKIATMFLVWFLIIALLPLVFYGYTSSRKTIITLKSEAINKLVTITDNKVQQIMTYFLEREKDVTSLASSPTVINALKKFKIAFENGKMISPFYGLASQNYYSVEKEFGHFFTYYKESVGYFDIFLISPEGDVVFTVAKEDDLGANLKTGPYKDSELAKVFERAKTLLETNMSDFKYYTPSSEPAAFIAAPVLSEGRLIGVVALQVDNDEINAIVNDYTGLGETGETIVASREGDLAVFVMPIRHDPYAAFRKKIFIGSEELLSIQKAIGGQKGYGLSVDYRGKEVLAVWRYIPHLRWGMVVKIDTEEAFKHVYSLGDWSLLIGVITTFVVILAALFISGSISNPIIKLTQTTKLIAGGNMASKVDIKGSIEIGELGASFNKMLKQLEWSREELTRHRDHLKELVEERTEDLKKAHEQLLSKERLAVFGKLSSGIAHEIRNPLATIGSSAYYLRRKLKYADEKTILNVNRIMSEVKESTAIIQGLQDLAKMETPQKTRIDVAKVIDNSINISRIPRIIKVAIGVREGEFFVDVDKRQMSMVFKNILTNAVQAMDNDGTIWINADRNSNNWVEVSIKDSGQGIEAENLQKIFQPFFGTKTKGFGFGLSICQMVMEKHGGEIEVQSEVGKGANFIIRFPSVETKIRSG